MAYHDITRIEQGGKRLYVLASGNLFTYNTADGEVRTFDKCNGLSDCAISISPGASRQQGWSSSTATRTST